MARYARDDLDVLHALYADMEQLNSLSVRDANVERYNRALDDLVDSLC